MSEKFSDEDMTQRSTAIVVRRKNLLQRAMSRVLPRDPNSVDEPGALGFYFKGPLWWIFEEDFDYHDEMYERIEAGVTELTYLEADKKFVEALKKKVRLHVDELTPAQKRFACLAINGAWIACRTLNTLRGDL